jgi:hypothetical protein
LIEVPAVPIGTVSVEGIFDDCFLLKKFLKKPFFWDEVILNERLLQWV